MIDLGNPFWFLSDIIEDNNTPTNSKEAIASNIKDNDKYARRQLKRQKRAERKMNRTRLDNVNVQKNLANMQSLVHGIMKSPQSLQPMAAMKSLNTLETIDEPISPSETDETMSNASDMNDTNDSTIMMQHNAQPLNKTLAHPESVDDANDNYDIVDANNDELLQPMEHANNNVSTVDHNMARVSMKTIACKNTNYDINDGEHSAAQNVCHMNEVIMHMDRNLMRGMRQEKSIHTKRYRLLRASRKILHMVRYAIVTTIGSMGMFWFVLTYLSPFVGINPMTFKMLFSSVLWTAIKTAASAIVF